MNLKKQNQLFVFGLVLTGAFLFFAGGEASAKDVNIGQSGDSVKILSDDFCLGGVCRTSWLWNLNGTSAYYNAGRVGIGTSTPGAGLHNNRTDGFFTDGSVTFGGPGYIGLGAASILAVDNSGNVYATSTSAITSAVGLPTSATNGQTLRYNNGSWVANSVLFNDGTNVGVGTANPQGRLHVGNTSYATVSAAYQFNIFGPLNIMQRDTQTDSYIVNNAFFNSAGQWQRVITGGAGRIGWNADAIGAMDFKVAPTGVGGTTLNWVNAMTILGDGNVGIGTTVPGAKLEIVTSGTGTFTQTQLKLSAPLDHAVNNWTGIDFGADGFPTTYRKGAIIYEALNGFLIGKMHFSLAGGNDATNASLSTSRMTIDYTGNVGISTTTPGYRLTLGTPSPANYTMSAGGYRIANLMDPALNTDAANKGYVDSAFAAVAPGGASSTWALSGSDIYNINSGNVGIGTANPNKLLEVSSTGTYTDTRITSGSNPGIELYTTNTNTAARNWRIGVSSNAHGDFAIMQSNAKDGSPLAGGGTYRFYIQNDGNIGIGTTGPNSLLTVGFQGSLNTNIIPTLRIQGLSVQDGTGNAYGSYGGMVLNSTNSYTASARRYLVTNALNANKFAIIRSVDSSTDPSLGNFGAITSGVADLVIDNVGNVGIGTTTPAAKLDVNGLAYFRQVASFYSSQSGQTDRRLTINTNTADLTTIYNYDEGGTTFHPIQIGNSSAGTGLTVLGTGNVGIATTTPGYRLTLGTPSPANYTMSAGNYRIGNVMDPTLNADAANKGYVDSAFTAVAPLLQGGASSTWIVSGSNIYNANSGKVGIGTTGPGAKLHIDTPLAIAPASTPPATAPFRISASADKNTILNMGIDPSGTTSAWLQAQHVTTAGTYYPLNLNPMGGNVGIGTTAPGAKLDVVNNFVTTSSTQHGVSLNTLISPTGASSAITNGLYNYIDTGTAQNTTGIIRGSYNYLRHNQASTLSDVRGGEIYVNNNIATANITNAYGQKILVENGSTGTIGTAYGLHIDVNNPSGTMTTGYGVYINDVDATNPYGIYQATADNKNYFAGSVGIGTTVPQKNLDVVSAANNFVTVGAAQMSVGQWAGIHFGYRENNTNYRKSAIVFERTDNAGGGGNAAGRIHILNGPATGGDSATLADAKLTIGELGNVGISTTTPGYRLTLGTPSPANYTMSAGGYRIANLMDPTLNADAANKGYVDSAVGVVAPGASLWQLSGTNLIASSTDWKVGIGTSNPQTMLTLGNNGWISSINNAGTGYINMFRVNTSNQIEVGGPLLINQFQFASDSGYNTFVDMPVTAAATLDSIQGYALRVDGENILTVYSESDGAGAVKNKRVGVGVTNPTANLHVNTDLSTFSAIIRGFSSSAGIVMSDATGALSTAATSSFSSLIFAGTSGQTLRHTGSGWQANSVIYNDGTNVAIGSTSPGIYKLKVYGNVGITGVLQTQTGSDFAEEFVVAQNIPAGTVVVIGDLGYKSVKASAKAYDKTVVGIVSDNPSIIAGRVESEHKVVVALAGVVTVKVNSLGGQIEKGDLLTSSEFEGYAMKADILKPGTIIGKALEDLDGRRGEIKVLVNLQ